MRLTLAKDFFARHFTALHALAQPWLGNLVDLIRLPAQRPDDLVLLRWDAFDGSQLRAIQGKTGVRLAIKVRPELRDVLAHCRDDVLSPFIVHRIPERIKSREQSSKRRQHHTQVFRTQAGRAFARLVKVCPMFANVGSPPTLYECKSFGMAELRGVHGWSLADVPRLAGHRTPRITGRYTKGHEAPFDVVGSVAEQDRSVTHTLP